jgi:hypothetical protein
MSTEITKSPIDKSLESYGRTQTYMGTFIGSIVLLVFFLIGLYMFIKAIKARNYTKQTKAIIRSIIPHYTVGYSRGYSRTRNTYSANITYYVDNKEYNNIVNVSVFSLVGSEITIYYNVRNPGIISTSSNTSQILIGSGIMVVSIIFAILLYLNTKLVSKSDIAAQDAALANLRPRYGYNTYEFGIY